MRRITAYGLCQDAEGRVLLAGTRDGRWAVPGGVVGHGVDPRTTVVTAFAEQAGVAVSVDGARDATTVIDSGAGGGITRQEERLVFDVHTDDPVTGDKARWVSPQDLDELPLTAVAAKLLGRLDGTVEPLAWSVDDSPVRRQRFAAYALATDPKGNVLLALIAPGYPGAGEWHLPGGGTNLGELSIAGLVRELTEETGQTGRVDSVLDVNSLYDVAASGPEGHPVDFHGVSVIYRVRVEKPTPARVVDPGGSTADAAWFAPHEALGLPLTRVARSSLLRALAAR